MTSTRQKFWAICGLDADGRQLLGIAEGRKVRVWEPATGDDRVLGKAKGQTFAVCAVRVGSRVMLASTGDDRAVRLWDPGTGREAARFQDVAPSNVNALCAVPGERGELLALAGDDGPIRVLDPAAGGQGRPLDGNAAMTLGLCHVRAGDRDAGGRLVSGGIDGVVRVWDPGTGRLAHELTGHEGWVGAVAEVTVDGRSLVASGGERLVIKLWDPTTGELVRTMRPKDNWHARSVTLAGGGTIHALQQVRAGGQRWLAAGGDFPGVWLWDPDTGRGAGWVGWDGATDPEPACGWVRGLTTYRREDGERLVTCGDDEHVQIFAIHGSRTFQGF